MAQVLVTESYLDDIADAIRDKTGSEDTYTPAQMADAIEDIQTADEFVLVSKSVTANGTYNPASDSADGYSGVTVNVPNTYTASDEGKVVSSGNLVSQSSKSITQNGTHDTTMNNSVSVDVPNTYTASDNGKVVVNQALTAQTSKSISTNGTHDTTANNSVVVDVPNSYAAADEGKVVSSGELVAQTSRNVTQNGTYDTTENNEVVVNVSGGGGLSDAFMSLDFTNESFSYGNVAYGLTGAVFDSTSDYIPLNMPEKKNITIEVDVAMMQLSSGTHRRFIMATDANGFIYRSNGKWAFYNGNWTESDITDGSYFDNSTVGVYIDTDNYWHIYKNGVLVYEPSLSQALNYNYYYNCLLIGSYTDNTINNARITGIRVYIGNHYGQ